MNGQDVSRIEVGQGKKNVETRRVNVNMCRRTDCSYCCDTQHQSGYKARVSCIHAPACLVFVILGLDCHESLCAVGTPKHTTHNANAATDPAVSFTHT